MISQEVNFSHKGTMATGHAEARRKASWKYSCFSLCPPWSSCENDFLRSRQYCISPNSKDVIAINFFGSEDAFFMVMLTRAGEPLTHWNDFVFNEQRKPWEPSAHEPSPAKQGAAKIIRVIKEDWCALHKFSLVYLSDNNKGQRGSLTPAGLTCWDSFLLATFDTNSSGWRRIYFIRSALKFSVNL